MAHRHLVLAYVLTWVIQLGYAGILASKWRKIRRADTHRGAPDRIS